MVRDIRISHHRAKDDADRPALGTVGHRAEWPERLLKWHGRAARRIGKAALSRQQHRIANCLVADDLGLMGKFEADPVALDPANGAFDGNAIAQPEMNLLPHVQHDIGADHCAAAGQVDQFDLVALAADLERGPSA